jgi:hypothetical protein
MQSSHQFNPSNIQYSPRSKRLKSSGDGGKFSQQEVDIKATPLYFAEGFEKVFLAIYFISLPYIAGLLFLFFYVSEGEYEIFLSLNQDSSFILTWAIGYEILAILTLLYIIKSAIAFTRENVQKGKRKKFHIP